VGGIDPTGTFFKTNAPTSFGFSVKEARASYTFEGRSFLKDASFERLDSLKGVEESENTLLNVKESGQATATTGESSFRRGSTAGDFCIILTVPGGLTCGTDCDFLKVLGLLRSQKTFMRVDLFLDSVSRGGA
jgi:hypothetical protein